MGSQIKFLQLKKMRKLGKNWSKSLRSYMKNSSVHGLKYIIDEEAHLLEKIFWICVFVSCVYGTFTVFAASWKSFKENPVSFVVETTYLDWNTTFPAVTVCEKRSPDKVELFSEKYFGTKRNFNLDTFVGEIAFFSGTCSSCIYHCGIDIECPDNLTYLTERLRSGCGGILKDCKWNGENFNCCEEFEPISTGFGDCYTINSMQGTRWWSGNRSIDLKSNRITGPGTLTFSAQEDIRLAVHSPEDVLFNHGSPDQSAMLEYGQSLAMVFQVVEIVNDVHVRDISVESRNCRFPDENPLNIYPYYSYSACITECEADAQMEYCGCIHHLMPKSSLSQHPVCNVSGLICISNHKEDLKVIKSKWSEQRGLLCECLSSCTEQEFKILQSQVTDLDYVEEEEIAMNSSAEEPPDYALVVSIVMNALPTERLSRNIVRTRLDIVGPFLSVSMGGTAGLFLGASLLSIVELIYYFLIRKSDSQPDDGVAQSKKRKRIQMLDYHSHYRKKAVPQIDTFLW